MADWKSALAALGATEEPNDNKENTDIDRKKRVGIVYSTNPDYEYSDYMFHESPYGSAPYDPYPCPRPSRTNYSPYSHAPLSMQEDPYYRRFI